MQLCKLTIPNRLGLHARAAAKLVRLANTFESGARVIRCDAPEKQADAKSILGILMLAATQNTTVELVTEGLDEVAAMDALRGLIESKFGEKE